MAYFSTRSGKRPLHIASSSGSPSMNRFVGSLGLEVGSGLFLVGLGLEVGLGLFVGWVLKLGWVCLLVGLAWVGLHGLMFLFNTNLR